MEPNKFPPAFGLSPENLVKVELVYAFNPGSPGNDQEFRIGGSKGVVLRRTSKDGKSETREAGISPEVLMALLDFFESEEFLAGPEEYGEKKKAPSRSITLILPGKRHRVTAYGEKNPEFEILAGAIQYAAGISLPEAVGHKFLPDL